MSKRHGRNQKRKHKAITKLLGDALRMTEGLLEHTSKKCAAAEATVTEMVRIIESVAKYSIALPAQKGPSSSSARERFQVATIQRIDVARIAQDYNPTAPMHQRVDLYALRLFLEENSEAFQAAVHLEYSAGGHAVYAISEIALQSVPEEYLVRRLAPEIARLLVEYLRSGKK